MIKDVIQYIGIDQLQRGRFQPRRDFDKNLLSELADSIREQGMIEPLIVRSLHSDDSTIPYEIIAGERRWRAAQIAGLMTVPCIVRNYSDEAAAAVTLVENIQRAALNPIEEARALHQLLDEFHYSHEQVARALGQSRTKITNCLRLLNLDPQVQQLLIQVQLTAGHGKVLAGLPTTQQYGIALQCCAEEWSVRKLEKVCQSVKKQGVPDKHPVSNDPNILRLERMASDHLSASVKLENDQQSRAGWLKVKYNDYDTLSGILKKMGVEAD